MSDIYWTFIYDGETYDAEFKSKHKAQEEADKYFAEQLSDDEMVNGEVFVEKIQIIAFKLAHDGERKVLATLDSVVEYEHYHGDAVEHGYVGV